MTTDTATREALIKAGLWTKPPRPEPERVQRGLLPFRNPLEMSNEEVVAEITQLQFDVAHINTQLSTDHHEGFPNGPNWRRRAGKARSSKNARLVQLTSVAATRGLAEGLPYDEALKRQRAERHKRELEEQHQEKLRRIRERAEATRATEENGLTREAMFVKAAYRLYSKDACDQIWKRARELFPDHPAWAERDKQS